MEPHAPQAQRPGRSSRAHRARRARRPTLVTPLRYWLWLGALGVVHAALCLTIVWPVMPVFHEGARFLDAPRSPLGFVLALAPVFASIVLAAWGVGALLRRRIASPDGGPRLVLSVVAHLAGIALSLIVYVLITFVMVAFGALIGAPVTWPTGELPDVLVALLLFPLLAMLVSIPVFPFTLPALPVTWFAIEALHRASRARRISSNRPA